MDCPFKQAAFSAGYSVAISGIPQDFLQFVSGSKKAELCGRISGHPYIFIGSFMDPDPSRLLGLRVCVWCMAIALSSSHPSLSLPVRPSSSDSDRAFGSVSSFWRHQPTYHFFKILLIRVFFLNNFTFSARIFLSLSTLTTVIVKYSSSEVGTVYRYGKVRYCCKFSVAEPPLFWAALALAPTYLGRLRLQAKIGGSGSIH